MVVPDHSSSPFPSENHECTSQTVVAFFRVSNNVILSDYAYSKRKTRIWWYDFYFSSERVQHWLDKISRGPSPRPMYPNVPVLRDTRYGYTPIDYGPITFIMIKIEPKMPFSTLSLLGVFNLVINRRKLTYIFR